MSYRRVKHRPFRHCRSRFFTIAHMSSMCVAHSTAITVLGSEHYAVHCSWWALARRWPELSVARTCTLLHYSDSVQGSLYCTVVYTVDLLGAVVRHWPALCLRMSSSHVQWRVHDYDIAGQHGLVYRTRF